MRKPHRPQTNRSHWHNLARALDFAAASPAARSLGRRTLYVGIAVLGAALMHLAVTAAHLAATRALLTEVQDQTKTLRHELAERVEPVSPLPRDASKWRLLLAAIERADDDGVALTHLRGDVEGAAFQLEMEARSREDVVRFVERLSPQPGIRSLHIRLLDERSDASHDRIHASLVGEWG